jgi:type I restriction enzyme S subunit
LGDVVEFRYGKSLPDRDRKQGDVPVYGSGGVGGFHNVALVSGPGVIVGRKGSVGSVFYEPRNFYPIDTTYYVAPKADLDLRYAFYLLSNLPLASMNSDVAVPGLNRDRALGLNIKIPSKAVQKTIVKILTTYDDLIENNRRRMALLEDSARQLYREWFVRLRFPGHEHTPIVDGVPQGWKSRTLGDLCREVRDMVLPEALEPDTPYIGLEHIPRRSISLNDWGTVEEVTSSKCRFKTGEIIFGKIRPYFHKVGVAFVDGVTSSDAIVVRPADETVHGLVLMTMSSDEFVAVTTQQMKEGSKMPRADWKQMKAFSIPVPPPGLLKSFDDLIQPTVGQLRSLSFANQKLRQARDLLLPRLMSGELAV